MTSTTSKAIDELTALLDAVAADRARREEEAERERKRRKKRGGEEDLGFVVQPLLAEGQTYGDLHQVDSVATPVSTGPHQGGASRRLAKLAMYVIGEQLFAEGGHDLMEQVYDEVAERSGYGAVILERAWVGITPSWIP